MSHPMCPFPGGFQGRSPALSWRHGGGRSLRTVAAASGARPAALDAYGARLCGDRRAIAGLSGGASRRSGDGGDAGGDRTGRSEEHTSELQSLMRISYAVFCLKKKKKNKNKTRSV